MKTIKITEEKLAYISGQVKIISEFTKDVGRIKTIREYIELSKYLGEIRVIWQVLCNDQRYTDIARKANDLMFEIAVSLDSADIGQLER